MSARPEISRSTPLRRAMLAPACLLLAGLWAGAVPAARKKPEAPPPAPAEVPGLHATADGFTLIEAPQVDPAVREQYARAIQLLQERRHQEGIALLQQITATVPTLTAAHVDLGIALAMTGDAAGAEESLRRAVELNPRHPVAWNELGLVQRRGGKFAEARASYEKALAAAPEFHVARLNLAILCDLYLADAGCALDNYLAYQQAAPGDAQAAIWIADLRARTGRKE